MSNCLDCETHGWNVLLFAEKCHCAGGHQAQKWFLVMISQSNFYQLNMEKYPRDSPKFFLCIQRTASIITQFEKKNMTVVLPSLGYKRYCSPSKNKTYSIPWKKDDNDLSIMFQSISFPGKFSLLPKTKHSIFGFTEKELSVWSKSLLLLSFMRRTHRHSYEWLLQVEEKFHNHWHMTINQCDLSPLAKGPKVIVHRRRVKTENSLSETINKNLINHGFLITSSLTVRLPVLHHQFRFLHWIWLCFCEWTPREWLVWVTFLFYFKWSWSAGTVQWLKHPRPLKKWA